MSKKTLIVLGASGVLALGIAAPAVAWATADNRGTNAAAAAKDGDRQQKLAEALAKELGVDQTKVADALKKVQEQLRAEAQANRDKATPEQARANHLEQLKTRLAEAVKAGKLTHAEADAIVKAAEAGVLNGGGGHGGPRPNR